MTFTVGPARPRPGNVRPRPGPQPAKLLLTSPGPARACKFQARTRPGPQHIIESWPGPSHGLRAGPARGPRPGPCRTLLSTTITFVFAMFILRPFRLLSSDSSCSICCSNCGVSVHRNMTFCHQQSGDWRDIFRPSSRPC